MQIPNSLITVICHTGMHRGPLIYPAYVANVLRKVYVGLLDVTAIGNGIKIEAYPENGDEAMRYRDVDSPEQELNWLRKVYGGVNGIHHADAVWNEESLKKEMTKLLMGEHERLRTAAKPKAQIAANPTFLAFGLTEGQARCMQAAGFADRAACVGQSIIDLASVPTITIDIAGRLAADDAKPEIKAKAEK